MDFKRLLTLQRSIKNLARELGNAYANKFKKQDTREVFFGALGKIVHLFPDANGEKEDTACSGVMCCIGRKVVCTTPYQCSVMGYPAPCDEHPEKPDQVNGQRYLRIAAHLLGDAYADKLEKTALGTPDQLEKVYNDSMQKVGELFNDANTGLKGLVVCQLPDGRVSGMTEMQCREIGGTVSK